MPALFVTIRDRTTDLPQLSLEKRLLTERPLLLDGPMGTELACRGVSIDGSDWSAAAISSAPDVIAAIHRDYLLAGTELLTANTFRTHARNLKAIRKEGKAEQLTLLAVKLAREAAGETAWVAGSQAPLEDCYRPERTPSQNELETEHKQMSEYLAAAGVDVILAETHPTIREAEAVVLAARNVGLPVMVSFVCGRDGRLLSGESLSEAAAVVLQYGPLAILVNCLPAESAEEAVQELVKVAGKTPVGVYANVGFSDAQGHWTQTDAQDPAVYAGHAEMWLSHGAKVLGGCCGTTPGHITLLRRLIEAERNSDVPSRD
ncbi:MAG: homocysteine S-methyltransferase family protein [Planctomycetaceae bacterium]